MALALYRKYRPQKFSDITNQEHIKITLQNEITMDQVAHAYIFAGPRGVGKTTTARIFAKALNCEKRKEKESEPCNDCPACNDINSAKAMDMIEIDAASHTGVENVRENIIENVRFSPSRLKFKVFIIDEAHMLSTQAFNALLKTLEEPPERVIFILATTEVHKIPNTIISRCQRFDFKKISTSEIVARMEYISAEEGVKVDKTVLERIARLSEGCVRDAESLLGQILALGEKKISQEQADLVLPHTNFEQVIEFLYAINTKNQSRVIEIINQLVHDGVELKQFSTETLEFLRELLLAKTMEKSSDLLVGWSRELQDTIAKILDTWSAQDMVRVIELLLQKQRDLKQAFPIQLPLEVFAIRAIELCAGSSFESNPLPPVRQDKSPAPVEKKPEPAKVNKKKSTNLTLDQVKEKWQDFMTQLEQNNHSLPLILKVSQPIDVRDQAVVIGLKYKFHQDRLMEAKNIIKAEEILSDVLGEKIHILSEVVAELDQEKISNQAVDQALEQFGGQVIE